MSSSSSDDDHYEPSAKRSKTDKSAPTSFVTWNVNGLISRCSKDRHELERLLRETNDPDILCLQEVRLKASSPHNRGTPLPADYKLVKETMESLVFRRYDKYYSLADNRYAGTCTLIHKRLSFSAQDSVAFSLPSALSLLLRKYNLTRADIGLNNNVNKTEAVQQNSPPAKKKQTTMKSFFAPKSTKNTQAAGSKATKSMILPEHHPEGRIQFLSFPNFDLLQTYVPNNGTKEESFQRRREWDRDMKEFLARRLLVLEKAATLARQEGNNDSENVTEPPPRQATNAASNNLRDRPLLWCGDMNVAKDFRDGTHWEVLQSSSPPPDNTTDSKCSDDDESSSSPSQQQQQQQQQQQHYYYEWWRDESKCFAGGQAKKLDSSRSQDDRGIPSFTTNERRRFVDILQKADLSDVWRTLHPEGCVGVSTAGNSVPKYKTQWDHPNWTWVSSRKNNVYILGCMEIVSILTNQKEEQWLLTRFVLQFCYRPIKIERTFVQ